MKMLKKIFLPLMSLCVCISLSACADQSWSVKSGDLSLSMGTYILLLSSSYQEAQGKLSDGDPYSSLDNSTSILNKTIDDKKASDWIKDETIKKCKEMIAIEKKFSEMNLSLTEEEIQKTQSSIEQVWNRQKKAYEKFGVSYDSYNNTVNLFPLKKQKLFDAMYGKEGTNAVSDEELEEYYKNNNANVSIIKKSLFKTETEEEPNETPEDAQDAEEEGESTDTDDTANDNTLLSDEEIEKIKNKFESYASDINNGSTTIAKVGETFKSEEKLEMDPVTTTTVSLEESTYSMYPDEVIEAIKSLEVSKATTIKADDTYYLVVKNDISSDLEKLKEDETRNSVLYSMKNKDFDNLVSEYVNQTEYTINNAGIKKHGPQIFERKVSA